LVLHLFRTESRRWVQQLAVVALVLVIIQGTLGGLRVTGRFTTSTVAVEMRPSTTLAVVHGILGQLFFGVCVSLAAVTSSTWKRSTKREPRSYAEGLRTTAPFFTAIVLLQLVLGAVLRHTHHALLWHVTLAVVVVLLGLMNGVRAWGQAREFPSLRKTGQFLTYLMVLQLLLGIGAMIVTGALTGSMRPYGARAAIPASEVLITAAHQACGALILGLSILLSLWVYRQLQPTFEEELDPARQTA
jgi:heme a synthase